MQLLEELMTDEVDKPVAIASKVPAATVYFWIVKILTTGMGETTSDFLLHTIKSRVIALSTLGLAFFAAAAVQILAKRYHAARYWTVVILVAVFGTMIADVIDFTYHLPLGVTTAVFATLVGGGLLAWWAVEGTLSIHSIVSRRRETFYWVTVMLTFIVGTAAGDLTADTLRLGFLGSGFAFLAMILLPLIAHKLLRLNEVLCFWVAYILTRPLGASFADWMAAPHKRGGLELRALKVSLIWAAAIAVMVVWMAMRRNEELPTAETA